MTASVYVNRGRTRVVPEGSPEAAFRVHVNDLARMGLASISTVRTAQIADGSKLVAQDGGDFAAPEAKEKPKPADKARTRPATK